MPNNIFLIAIISLFKNESSMELTCAALLQLNDVELAELLTKDSQTEKECYETLAGHLQMALKLEF